MTKKIVLGVALFALIGLLVAGGVVRTVAKAGEGIEAHGSEVGNGQGAGRQGQELAGSTAGQGGLGDGTGTGQAQVDQWLTVQGTVVSIDAAALVVQTTGGEQIVVEDRPWSFAQEQGFVARPGDLVTLVGFYEGDTLEIGQIADETTGQAVQLREDSGRPMWAGRGRRGG